MLNKIIQFSIKNKLIIGLFTLVLILWGSYAMTQLPIDAVPDITDNQIMIITPSPTLAAQEVEQLVTFPIEQTMVTIPDIDNMRSFSRFGLSIVTLVFKEKVDIYWARQQVQERLIFASKNMPSDVGIPEMAPVTTGLGEIYQYVVHAKPGYEDNYDATTLRSLQDWVIKRQLLGTPGVAEVSGFGGFVKQYQVNINTHKLATMQVSINDLFEALQRNNQNTGGAYIERNPYAYFIRTEGLVKNLSDIKQIVIKKANDGTPILIRDVAKVEFGHGIRYGAVIRNGEGEAVTGTVMMLKGANSSKVVNAVKEKIEQIKKTLPEGVVIEPYLDRTKLVNGAISTVARNLAEGALIVIFVLILFLGNIRGGLVVASVIPLAMLFAFGLMDLFGVSGNLLSLGAIDFGLIVDGSVIIIESIIHTITKRTQDQSSVAKLTTQQMDREVFLSASKIRTSASFGELIILVVYLPLWTLTGIEGKMFTPMAQTVSFAIFGAFILSLTYVPMMAALCLKCNVGPKKINFSDRMMLFFEKHYQRLLDKVLVHKKIVVSSAVSLFLAALVVFHSMGSEFIPQLDEGDFAVEMRIPGGSSLHQSITLSLKAQKILLANFPEIKQIVNRIGAGEVPTDPMPVEACDMMIVLKPRSEWVTANNREDLAQKMLASLDAVSDAAFSFQQPIQMRFNELLTGAKQDVVLKIYGEDLNTLSTLSKQVGKEIADIEGVNDLYVEEITGVPQIRVRMKRDKIAQYGLNVSDINRTIEIGFAGQSAGIVYEKERQFDLVVRLEASSRSSITDVQNLLITIPDGHAIPLREVADVRYQSGPVQIQRDNARRRITVGYNVRGRDVKSTVKDIKKKLAEKIVLPVGYSITYGGQFENLQTALQRLAIALPLALLLIFFFLYFTFYSMKQSLLIFTAIPLSAIGGVFALYLRGMPFSISAGVGFIALFGIAVLNGIVLIGEFNHLAKQGVTDIYDRVKKGTKVRLRPVLMTALVASLGFLPMALSNTAGAEVQRPLATVVIGGLITATFLTLVVLPILYIFFTPSHPKLIGKKQGLLGLIFLLFFIPSQLAGAQNRKVITLTEAIDQALDQNLQMKIAQYGVAYEKALKKGAITLPKMDFSYTQGELNGPGLQDNSFDISQSLAFPTLYINQSKLAKAKILSAEKQKDMAKVELIEKVKKTYWKYVYVGQKIALLKQQDERYQKLCRATNLRYENGESTQLESVTSEAQAFRIRNEVEQLYGELTVVKKRLQSLLYTSDNLIVVDTVLAVPLVDLHALNLSDNTELAYLKNESVVAQKETHVQRSLGLPEFSLGFTSLTFKGTPNYSDRDRFSAFTVGVAIPLFPSGNRAKVKALKQQEQMFRTNVERVQNEIEEQFTALVEQYKHLARSLQYYQKKALPQADLITLNSQEAFKKGDISYTQLVQNMTLAYTLESEYLDTLLAYNFAVIEIKTLCKQNNIK